MNERIYRVRQFAKLAGVTVRTLHHYDHLGLLKPHGHSEAGYRLYSDADLLRLQQIITLQWIGVPLRQIRELLDGQTLNLAELLRMQRTLLQEQQRRIEQAIRAIQQAETVAAGNDPDSETIINIIKVITMATNNEWVKEYYTPEQLDAIEKRATPETITQGQQAWGQLIADIEEAAANGVDPASAEAQTLIQRQESLIEGFTGGDAGTRENLNKLWSDKSNWPATFKSPYSPAAEAFLEQARKHNK
ncbi:MAG: MerR family transcriptional regulator [Chlorobi bacterium]|nr:MAG: transcriptional regulator [Chlorobi bacterium OLB7]MBK8912724.1 MerR family transcriptional regulator [Chlorobiota bacterium]MBX7216466.1 MerR family transcriptional regulator [Candidatus Kapabacteria bacterium]